MDKVIYAYREYKPMKDTIEYTFYLHDQLGNKKRWDFELPAGIFDNLCDNSDLIIREETYRNPKGNRYRTEYYEPDPEFTFEQYVYSKIYPQNGYEKYEGVDRVNKFLDDPGYDGLPRRERFREYYEQDVEREAKARERFAEIEAKAKELGLSDEEAGIVRRKDMVWRDGFPTDEEVFNVGT